MKWCGLKQRHMVCCIGKHKVQNATFCWHTFPETAKRLLWVDIRNHLLKLIIEDFLMCTPFLHRMGSLTTATVCKSTQSVRAMQGLLNNCKQTHGRAFPVWVLTPTKTQRVDRRTVVSVLGKGSCSESAPFQRICGWDGIGKAARLPCDSEGELPPTWGGIQSQQAEKLEYKLWVV